MRFATSNVVPSSHLILTKSGFMSWLVRSAESQVYQFRWVVQTETSARGCLSHAWPSDSATALPESPLKLPAQAGGNVLIAGIAGVEDAVVLGVEREVRPGHQGEADAGGHQVA